MLMRFDPFREFDRLTEQVFGGVRASMPVDAYRKDGAFFVHFDLPGIDPNSIDLTVERNVLTVTAKREWSPDDAVEINVAERPHRTFTRQLFVGDSLDTDHIEASYDAGVLTVRLPVADHAKARRVEITTGGGGVGQIEASSTAA